MRKRSKAWVRLECLNGKTSSLKVAGKALSHRQLPRVSNSTELLKRLVQTLTVRYADPQEVFSVSFFPSPTGELQGAQLTHENITAGVAAARALVPLSNAITPLDTIVSALPLNTAYGRAIAYTALFEGTSFATLDSTKLISHEAGKQLVCDCL